MAPQLLLLRHALAAATTGPDGDRALTDAGRAQARAASRGLARLLPARARVLSSPARRCRETADLVAQAVGQRHGQPVQVETRDELSLDGPLAPALELARAAGAGVVLVGHQPDLLGLAAALLAPAPVAFHLPPAGVLGLSCGEEGPLGPWLLDLAAAPAELAALAGSET